MIQSASLLALLLTSVQRRSSARIGAEKKRLIYNNTIMSDSWDTMINLKHFALDEITSWHGRAGLHDLLIVLVCVHSICATS